MSMLVLIILDFEQKGAMNGLVDDWLKHKDIISEQDFVRWVDRATSQTKEKLISTKPMPENKLMSSIFFKYVAPFVHVHKHADKMLRLDGDVEQFVWRPNATITIPDH